MSESPSIENLQVNDHLGLYRHLADIKALPTPENKDMLEFGFVVDDAREMFKVSQLSWEKAAGDLMGVISISDDELLSDDEMEQLADTRKFGSIFKTSWWLLHGDHLVPKELYSGIKRIGKLKDTYAWGEKANRLEAIELLSSSANNPDTYKPITWDSFVARASEMIDLETLHSDEAGFKEYHRMRKGFRHLANMYLLKSVLNNGVDVDYASSFRIVSDLYKQMGSKIDEALLEMHESGNEQKSFIIDEDIRGVGDQLMERLRKKQD